MDQSKLNFLQSVLKYSTLNSDGTKPIDEKQAKVAEMDPEVSFSVVLRKIASFVLSISYLEYIFVFRGNSTYFFLSRTKLFLNLVIANFVLKY